MQQLTMMLTKAAARAKAVVVGYDRDTAAAAIETALNSLPTTTLVCLLYQVCVAVSAWY